MISWCIQMRWAVEEHLHGMSIMNKSYSAWCGHHTTPCVVILKERGLNHVKGSMACRSEDADCMLHLLCNFLRRCWTVLQGCFEAHPAWMIQG